MFTAFGWIRSVIRPGSRESVFAGQYYGGRFLVESTNVGDDDHIIKPDSIGVSVSVLRDVRVEPDEVDAELWRRAKVESVKGVTGENR